MLGIDLGGEEENFEYSKTLVIAPLDTVCFKRYFMGTPYQYPVTIELVGFAGEIFGVSIKVYDPAKPHIDSNSIFLMAMNTFELANKSATNKKKRNNISVEDYKQKFGIIEMLSVFGFDLLLKRALQPPSNSKTNAASLQNPGVPQVLPLALTSSFSTKFGTLDSYLRLYDVQHRSN